MSKQVAGMASNRANRRGRIIKYYIYVRIGVLRIYNNINNTINIIGMRRVVITGMGMVSPLANNLTDSWAALLAGHPAIFRYENDQKLRNVKPLSLALVRGFDEKKWAVPHATSRQNGFVVCASQEAVNMSQLDLQKQDKSRIGICMGVIGSNTTKISDFVQESVSSTFQNINRLSLLHLITSIPTGVLNVRYKTNGPTLTVNTACASGLSAVVQAAKSVRYDEADIVLAGGVEDSYNPIQINSCLRIQAMTSKAYQKAEQSSRPFDRNRSGFVLGEGCGMLIVEQLNHAKKRGAKIYAEILGTGESSDGYHLVKPIQTGVGQMRAMEQALSKSGIDKSAINLVDAHSTSTPAGDEIQANSIKTIFGEHQPLVSANKSSIGHTLGAAGALQLIFAIQAMNNSIVPRIRNLEDPDVTGINYAKDKNVETQINYLLKNSFGFGGVNVSAVLAKYRN